MTIIILAVVWVVSGFYLSMKIGRFLKQRTRFELSKPITSLHRDSRKVHPDHRAAA